MGAGPPSPAPPQYSADGRWWWNGREWVPVGAAPQQPPAFDFFAPAPGLRIVLLVALGLTAAIFGLFTLWGLVAVAAGSTDFSSLVFFAVFAAEFVVAAVALVGVAARTPWARVAAIIDGVAVSLTCLGLVLGIPIL